MNDGFKLMEDMQINELLSKETVAIGLSGHDKTEVISSIVELLSGHEHVADLKAVKQAVFEREKVMSTGVGKGLALPHAKTAGMKTTVAALAITAEPVDFGAIDNEFVRILFLLVGPQDAKSQHVRILSRISRIMNQDDVRKAFLDAESSDDILELLKQSETELLAR